MSTYGYPAGLNISGGFVEVYADGSCLNNGRPDAQAGIGVWFADDHRLNLSEPCPGPKASNHVAEIRAILRAAQQALRHDLWNLRIYTDSKVIVDSINNWLPNLWEKNDWRSDWDGSPIQNKDELRELNSTLKRLNFKLIHVPGHSGIHGNMEANRLAKEGAKRFVIRR